MPVRTGLATSDAGCLPLVHGSSNQSSSCSTPSPPGSDAAAVPANRAAGAESPRRGARPAVPEHQSGDWGPGSAEVRGSADLRAPAARAGSRASAAVPPRCQAARGCPRSPHCRPPSTRSTGCRPGTPATGARSSRSARCPRRRSRRTRGGARRRRCRAATRPATWSAGRSRGAPAPPALSRLATGMRGPHGTAADLRRPAEPLEGRHRDLASGRHVLQDVVHRGRRRAQLARDRRCLVRERAQPPRGRLRLGEQGGRTADGLAELVTPAGGRLGHRVGALDEALHLAPAGRQLGKCSIAALDELLQRLALVGEHRQQLVGLAQRRVGAADRRVQIVRAPREADAELGQEDPEPLAVGPPECGEDGVDLDRDRVALERHCGRLAILALERARSPSRGRTARTSRRSAPRRG